MLLADLLSIVPVSVEYKSDLHVVFIAIDNHITSSFLQRIFQFANGGHFRRMI